MTPTSPCPLCGSSEAEAVLAIAYDAIWEALREQLSVTISGDVQRANQPASDASLVRCGTCALEYFVPIAPGDQAFYRELMAVVPYETHRWDFEVVRRSLEPALRVLDLGCGGGAFLTSIAGSVERAVGVDTNEVAIARLAAEGLDVHAMSFADFAADAQDAFDVVCSFHTLEHLGDPAELLEPAVRCARPGGRIFVSVPNRHRYARAPLEPLDCPPHHVSRWEAEQFRTLADRSGLRLAAVSLEEPDISHARLEWVRRGHGPRPAAYERLGELLARVAVSRARYERMIAAGTFVRRGMFGHTIMAELVVPG